jgi:hypothetical protein
MGKWCQTPNPLAVSPDAEAYAGWLMKIGNGDNWVGADQDGHNLVDIPGELYENEKAKIVLKIVNSERK